MYDEYGLPDLVRITYIGDTVIDGHEAQKREDLPCFDENDGTFICGAFNGPFYDYTTVQGDVVLQQSWRVPTWDTLYWLGIPGDRWWPLRADTACPGPGGMLEIQDTGHVMVDGIQLRTWQVAVLDNNGLPYLPPWYDLLYITERIGLEPRICPISCSAIVDCFFGPFVHYSDNEIDLFDNEWTCDIPMRSVETGLSGPLRMEPNPGTELFRISGLDLTATVEAKDALGRSMHRQRYVPGTAIGTEGWHPGTYLITIQEGMKAPRTLRWMKQ